MSHIAGPLMAWRRSEGLTQTDLARRLGVSQQAISYWERGKDIPGPSHMAQIRSLLTQSGELNIEKAFIRNQTTVRALFDCDDLKLLGVSAGFANIWPDFSRMIDVPLRNDLVNESAALYGDASFRAAIMRKDIVAAAGVSERHVRLEKDIAFKHRWFVRMRHFGARMVGDMIFETCDADVPTGLECLVKPDEWIS